ncbi:hypothetical protein PR048_033524 [Dryococelus australis]|uniref:Uncharacterized protein n=1 Tax=Dryococelus australis TaxID=614101 RepID=A0ABQ9G0J6_9NEOP|nr:hypothetical protein PR048_033524 [Dryococelus australis]
MECCKETWILGREDAKRLEVFEMWTWRRMERVSWVERGKVRKRSRTSSSQTGFPSACGSSTPACVGRRDQVSEAEQANLQIRNGSGASIRPLDAEQVPLLGRADDWRRRLPGPDWRTAFRRFASVCGWSSWKKSLFRISSCTEHQVHSRKQSLLERGTTPQLRRGIKSWTRTKRASKEQKTSRNLQVVSR